MAGTRMEIRGLPWLRPRASTAGGAGSIPGRGIKIPRAVGKTEILRKMNKIFLKKNGNKKPSLGHDLF